MTSYIYFIQAHGDGPIKIGTTRHDPRRRMVKIQSDCPWPVSLLGAIKGSVSQEKQIHSVLSHFQTQGEWFLPHPIVLAAVAEAIKCGESIAPTAKPQRRQKHQHALCEYRLRNNLSLRALAEITGFSIASLSRFETGRNRPNASTLIKLCNATGLDGAAFRPDWAPMFTRGTLQ